jgi:hypothetical protein
MDGITDVDSLLGYLNVLALLHPELQVEQIMALAGMQVWVWGVGVWLWLWVVVQQAWLWGVQVDLCSWQWACRSSAPFCCCLSECVYWLVELLHVLP